MQRICSISRWPNDLSGQGLHHRLPDGISDRSVLRGRLAGGLFRSERPVAMGTELSLMPSRAFATCALPVRIRFGGTNTLAKRFLEASGTMMFFQQIAKSFVRQFLKAHRPISRELIERDEVFRLKLDDLAAHLSAQFPVDLSAAVANLFHSLLHAPLRSPSLLRLIANFIILAAGNTLAVLASASIYHLGTGVRLDAGKLEGDPTLRNGVAEFTLGDVQYDVA